MSGNNGLLKYGQELDYYSGLFLLTIFTNYYIYYIIYIVLGDLYA